MYKYKYLYFYYSLKFPDKISSIFSSVLITLFFVARSFSRCIDAHWFGFRNDLYHGIDFRQIRYMIRSKILGFLIKWYLEMENLFLCTFLSFDGTCKTLFHKFITRNEANKKMIKLK